MEDETSTDPSSVPTMTPSLPSSPTDLSPSSSSSSSACPPDSDKDGEFWTGELKSKADVIKEPLLKKCTWLADTDKATIKKYCSMTKKGYWKGIVTAKEACTGTCDSC